MTGDGTWTHTYDTENHLLSSAKTGTSLAFKYDPFHRQVQKSVTTSGTAVTNYVYSGWQRIADYDGSGSLLNRYVYGVSMDEAIIQVSPTGVLTFLHGDHEGSIVATSDFSGKMLTKNTYGVFGEIASVAGTSVGYTGQRFDSETGLYYYKRRYYSPKLGRFLQPDPIGYDVKTSENCGCDCTGGCGGAELSTLNLYAYVNNDPLNMIDPMGLDGIVRRCIGKIKKWLKDQPDKATPNKQVYDALHNPNAVKYIQDYNNANPDSTELEPVLAPGAKTGGGPAQ